MVGLRDGRAFEQVEVYAHAEGGCLSRDLGGLFGCGGAGHQGGAGEETCAVCLDDCPVDSRAEAEIVGIYDELLSHWGESKGKGW